VQKVVPKRPKPKARPKPKPAAASPKPPAAQPKPELASAPVAAVSSSNGPTTTMLLGGVGLVLALLAVGISLVPAWSVPVGVGIKLERNRQTIALSGLAIGAACAFVGLLTVLSGP
ncbi:MAG: hypothetical protein M3R39_03880, partial [Actinomycetota bacterium]|nr:hypothetical protein [Actinomycetota bacterium]